MTQTFQKVLSANDVGETGAHQGGILIPKSESELLAFLPQLKKDTKNPDAWINCINELENPIKLRFVYYNNRLHDEKGTRNEYRMTYMTKYFREMNAKTGDIFEISKVSGETIYRIRIIPQEQPSPTEATIEPTRIKLQGWQRVH